jgi:hypothetical protein
MAKRKKSDESFGSTVARPSATASDTAVAHPPLELPAAIAERPSDAISERASEEEESERARADARGQISSRAYEIYQERGYSHGHDVEDWLEAERQLGRGFDRPTDD